MNGFSSPKTERQNRDTTRAETQRCKTLEALADVSAGRVIDHRIVKAWAASLDSGEDAASGNEAD